ncbi:Glutamyl-tRNA amidotransferase [Acetobacteraceae bacterium EV16G]|uniref:Glutamyl-tRNA amidotransferase n=1 Tax=Sorlinia euscelidii TaxID=3081148 RepID=A0ABU7U140_9PROT
MSLRDRINEDLKTAMKARDMTRVAQLRAITSRFKDLDIELRAKDAELDEGTMLSALRSMIKSRRESAALYRQGDRPELAEKEEAEITAIEHYLPPPLSDAELDVIVQKALAETGADSVRDLKNVMSWLRSHYGAQLDMGKMSGIVKAKLG